MYHSFILILSPMVALAALYPTSPTKTTVFRSGHAHPKSVITWIDDDREPRAYMLGNMKVDLLLANTTIQTLGRNVSATQGVFKTYMPSCPDGSDYAIVFMPPSPFDPVYSARFSISNDNTTHRTDRYNTPSPLSLPVQPPTTTTAPHSKPSRTFMPNGEKIGTTKNGGRQLRKVDSKSTRFRALYVLWPVFVGAALAS